MIYPRYLKSIINIHGLKIYLTKILKLKLRKVKWFIQRHIARKWQKQDSDPSCLMLRAWLYSQYAMMPPLAAVLYVSFYVKNETSY